jgi:hypothetical protein
MIAAIIRSRAKPVRRDSAVKPPTEKKLRYIGWLRITRPRSAEWRNEGFIPNSAFRVGAFSGRGPHTKAPAPRHWQRGGGQVKNLAALSADDRDRSGQGERAIETTI